MTRVIILAILSFSVSAEQTIGYAELCTNDAGIEISIAVTGTAVRIQGLDDKTDSAVGLYVWSGSHKGRVINYTGSISNYVFNDTEGTIDSQYTYVSKNSSPRGSRIITKVVTNLSKGLIVNTYSPIRLM